ncbi:ParM/StbA family protein [Desmospora profundinema]|uniref:Plasmid segregation protein ParM n=1 Tax=Desmospora profundinema TaxID=1571184 RepID=A0ABU1IJN1_9BACL|nr:ParM/StbA family protein [Desmospora profundinema]MDR6224987.1 plasmid segregation protein ParM [Desmospora profundinema]
MIVAVDCGRSYVKVITEGKSFLFPSKVSGWRQRNYRHELSGDIELEYLGRRWFVGKLAEREGEFTRQAMQDSKAVEETLILTMTALHLAEAKGNVILVTGLPIGNFTDVEQKAIKRLLEGPHTVRLNGKERSFYVESVYATIEGGGAFFSAPRMGLVRIVDVGAKTTNYATFRDKVFIDRESGTLPIGWETVKVTNLKEMADLIASTVSKTWGNHDIVMLVGGMARKLEPFIQDHFRHAFSLEEPQMANVRGYYEVGKAMIR